jgi:hypothetical protein
MANNVLKALVELGYKVDQLPFKDYIQKNETKLIDGVLYYKDIPSALLFISQYITSGIKLEDHSFDVFGTMIDLSRNAVFTVDYFKQVIKNQAQLGYNEIWLYMEDVYELINYPKLGYLRGKYKKEELEVLVEYAEIFGVHLVPCIQTLGHMGQYLRWFSNTKLKDQSDILLAEDEAVFELIKEMVKTMKSIFKTDKIHIGMDETFGHGFGRYYKINGYKNPKQIFLDHLKKVNDICVSEGYSEVCVWSDMFFRTASVTDSYYDPNITFSAELINQIPTNVSLVYWDYYNSNEDLVKKMLENHLKMNRKVIMASGTWIWTKLNYDKKKTDATAKIHLKLSKELGIKEVILTQWNDDGAYCDYDTQYLGLFDLMNEQKNNKIDRNLLDKMGLNSYDNYVVASKINELGFSPVHLLWDDLLLGIYLNQFAGYDYLQFDTPLRNLVNYEKELTAESLGHTRILAEFFRLKLSFRRNLLKAYFETKDFNPALIDLAQLENSINSVNDSFTYLWHKRNKPFGLEVLQTRIYAQISRVKEAKYQIESYIKKQISQIDFLEEVIVKEPYLPVKYIDVALSSKQ